MPASDFGFRIKGLKYEQFRMHLAPATSLPDNQAASVHDPRCASAALCVHGPQPRQLEPPAGIQHALP